MRCARCGKPAFYRSGSILFCESHKADARRNETAALLKRDAESLRVERLFRLRDPFGKLSS